MSDEQIQELEITMEQATAKVDTANSLDKLYKNRDFKKLVTEGYFEKEAIRLVHMKSNPRFANPEDQAMISSMIDGIGHFATYLRTISQHGQMAKDTILETEEALEEINNDSED